MIFKFRIISDRVDNFVLRIDADSNNTFFQLHEEIQEVCRYDPSELSSFYLADEEWDKGDEISMFDISTSKKWGTISMKHAKLGDFLKSKEDKLIYVFDMVNQKSLYIELYDIIMDKKLLSPVVTLSKGTAPGMSSKNQYDTDLLVNEDPELQNFFTDFGELEDLNLIYGEIGEVI